MTLPSSTVLFIQGGGEGTHDEWDDKLVAGLSRELGPSVVVRYPRMPAEADPTYATWGPAIHDELVGLGDGGVVVGHSIGGTILVQAIAEAVPVTAPLAIVLIAAPFVGAGGWPPMEFELTTDLGDRLPPSTTVDLFHGLDDQEVPPTHVDLYSKAIPRAHVHRQPGRDHQLGNDLTEVARVIRTRLEGATT